MKVKKFLPLILSLFMVGGVFAGCANGNSGDAGDGGNTEDVGGGTGEEQTHTHEWASGYTSDGENGHYHKATCHPEEHDEAVPHTYDESYVCTECHYEHEHVWSEGYVADKKGRGHYKVTECTSHDEVVKGTMVDHVFDNDMDATCNICNYERIPPHVHTWGNDYTDEGAKGHTLTSTCTEHDPVKSEYYSHVFDDASDLTCNTCGYTREADTSTALAYGTKIYVVGDSTVCSFDDNYYLPRYGYGTQLSQYLNVTETQIVNLAMSGRSSKSYLSEANYTTLTSSIKSGDYLIIGFGHNDEKSEEDARYTDANGTHTQPKTANGDSFQYTLYENYVKMAKDKGATPILCTPIVRYDSSGNYTGAKAHDTTASDKLGKGGDYAAAIKALGAATNTTVIDLTKITADIYKSDNSSAQYFHAHTSYVSSENKAPAGRDDTHINRFGAQMVAYEFAQALKDTDCSLKAQEITNALAPTKGTDYAAAIKDSYVKPDYKPFDPNTTVTKNVMGLWYMGVMGDIGGTSKLSNFSVSAADGKITVSNKGQSNGKINASVDGFASAFRQIDASTNFKITVTATLKTVPASCNAETAFGIMLRDDIIVNMEDKNLASNYVAAGVLNTKGDIFYRENGTLSSENADSATLTQGAVYQLEIERVGQTVTVKVGNNTQKFTDFDFNAIDEDYMYLCLFANRGLEVEFSDINYEVTGTSQGA